VPNHMALVAGQWRNAPLWDVLRHGRESTFAHWFDVDWEHLGGRFGLPILGGPLAAERFAQTTEQASELHALASSAFSISSATSSGATG